MKRVLALPTLDCMVLKREVDQLGCVSQEV
jgi:hypothetical protein